MSLLLPTCLLSRTLWHACARTPPRARRVSALGLALADDASQRARLTSPGPNPRSARARPEGFRFHGYLRSGFGVSGEDTPGSILCAECGGEVSISATRPRPTLKLDLPHGIAAPEDLSFFDTRITISYVTPTSRSNLFATTLSLREASGAGPRRNRFAAGCVILGRFALLRSPRSLHVGLLLPRHERLRGGVDLRWGGARVASRLAGRLHRRAGFERRGTADESIPVQQEHVRLAPVRISRLAAGWRSRSTSPTSAEIPSRFGSDNSALRNNVGWAAAPVSRAGARKGRNRLISSMGPSGERFPRRDHASPGRTFTPAEIADPRPAVQVRVVGDLVLDAIGPISLLVGGVSIGRSTTARPRRTVCAGARSACAPHGISTATSGGSSRWVSTTPHSPGRSKARARRRRLRRRSP